MTRSTILLLFALLPAVSWGAEPQAPSKTQGAADPVQQAEAETETDATTMSVWMEKKLKHSQAILRGLAMGDFEDVKYNAGRLKLLNRVEGFVRRRHPSYRVHVNTFSRVSSEIERQAEKKNIEGATLAFNQLTVSCVECHKSLRNDEAADAESPGLDQLGAEDEQ
ncbi:hypothetical protein Enr13x_25770 [Stieleria neptunia]|uniref:Cytochrome C n=1 Tax=Stieleria neptunia TaxID=2527979 RepID=A0A518HPL9_9BACT|nr:hypothetical protein [Stieleria neptunia]QDV42727.1 hypothetical protein Enr13x_25770 [Stieleria neptunia]